MEIVLKGRGYRITDQIRAEADHKFGKLSRLEPRAVRVEVEIISETSHRQIGAKRIEGCLVVPRKTFRAHAENVEVGPALDEVAERLERQVRDHHGKMRVNKKRAGNRVESAAEATREPD